MNLGDDELVNDRYSRQTLFNPIGENGQKKISRKHVLLVGAGALGTGNAEALVRAGLGQITIIDRDYVDLSNLQRQQLYSEDDVQNQLPKAVAAKKKLSTINSNVKINIEVADFLSFDFKQKMKEVDLIIDATDNFETRLLINDIATKFKIPWIYGACIGSSGMTFTFRPGTTPCFNCLLKKIPNISGQTCDTVGIISPAVSMVTSYQVVDALKILVEDYDSLDGKLTIFDLWQNVHSKINIEKAKDDHCPSCGQNPDYPYLSNEHQTKSSILCGRDTVQIRPPKRKDIDLKNLGDNLTNRGIRVKGNSYLLSIDVSPQRMVLFSDGRVLVHGTKDIAVARRLYHQFLG